MQVLIVIRSFIHLYSAPLRNLLMCVPSPTTATRVSFEQFVEHERVTLW